MISRHRRPRLVAAFVALLAAATACATGDSDTDAPETTPSAIEFDVIATVRSPDDALSIGFGVTDDGIAAYRVDRTLDGQDGGDNGQVAVIEPSPIGLLTSDGSFLDGLIVADVTEPDDWSDSFDLPTGKQRSRRVDGSIGSVTLHTGDDSTTTLTVDLLATDAAVALRTSVVAADRQMPLTVHHERFGLSIPPESSAWFQPRDEADQFRPGYERLRSPRRSVTSPPPSPQGWNLPVLFERDGLWTFVSEADVNRDWPASHLGPSTSDGAFFTAFPTDAEGNGVGLTTPSGFGRLTSPWRIIMASDDLADIVESDIVRHLSPSSSADLDFSWVEPGRVSWSWWSDPASPTDPDRLIDFVELSQDFRWEYSLIDANWNELDDDEFDEIVEAADQAGVGLFLWYNSGGPHNTVTEAPRGLMTDRTARRAEMQRISELGIRGVKVDFFHSDKPASMALHLDILEDAADFELLVNFHGTTLPRGWSRTWPNLMTMESVPGAEQYIFNPAYAAQAPAHNVLLAFTRNVVGSMDYTPTMLGDTRPRRTTNAHELALGVVFESGLTHFVDTPEAYEAQPDEVRDTLAEMPTTWDEVRLLDGSPDSHVAIARRNGTDWWVGVINGTDEVMTLRLDLAPLGTERRRVCDGDTNREYTISAGDDGPLELAAYGGCVVVLS